MFTTCEVLFFVSIGLLIYTYLAYPLLAALIGGKRHEAQLPELPGITVFVPAHNEADVIEAKIENFHALDYPSDCLEMLIVDDGYVAQKN